MFGFNFFNFLFGDFKIQGSDRSELIFGSFGDDDIAGNGGNDLIFGLFGDDKISGGSGDDAVFGGFGHDSLNGGDGEDFLSGGFGNDWIVGNKGNDTMLGGRGNDMLVWNNGDGSDLMNGGSGYDRVQVNFDTDLVNDNLQNKDVAEFSLTDAGVQFTRTVLNDQTERGLFQLDIRETEALETNFGGGEDTAEIKGAVLDEIMLDIDGGDGLDTLDLSQVAAAIQVDLRAGTMGASTAENFENVIGTTFADQIKGDGQANVISGLGGDDTIRGRSGDDTLVGGKGNDTVFGGRGDDTLVWNNGDGSDLLNGGRGYDVVQVNFDTNLVNDDLQNKDVAEFSATGRGVEFARVALNDQTEAGLFQLDIRKTEMLETNFGGGDDTAVIKGDVLNEITLDLDGGAGVDLLDLSLADAAVTFDLGTGTIATGDGLTAINFENITGTAFDDTITGNDLDNVIRGGSGNDTMRGGDGADTFVFFEADTGVDVILDFEFGVDTLAFRTTNPEVTADNLMANLTQVGAHVELALNNKVITFDTAVITDFTFEDFMIA
jgi:Ca2+-binding RTX toxin-like protein